MLARRNNKLIKCANPGHPTGYATLRRCPLCNVDLPLSVLQNYNLPICIVGVASSGKTNYITVMLHELNKIENSMIALSFQNTETMMHQANNRRLIYENRQPPAAANFDDPMPQIWEIRYNTNKSSGSSGAVNAYNFTIFDGAGEAITTMNNDSRIARYISKAKAFLLVVDPLTLESVRNGNVVDEEDRKKSLGGGEGETWEANIIVNQITNKMRELNSLNQGKKLDIPVAVVLTKFDTILNSYPQFSQNATIRRPKLSIVNDRIDTDEIDDVHNSIKGWLETIGENGIISSLEHNYNRYKLFGVSSYGEPPIEAYKLPRINPHRVLDPILWLFKDMGYIE